MTTPAPDGRPATSDPSPGSGRAPQDLPSGASARDRGYDPYPSGAVRGSAGAAGEQRRRGAPLGWLPWTAIALLLALVAVIAVATVAGLRDERDLALVGPQDDSVTQGDQAPGTEGRDPEAVPDGPDAAAGVGGQGPDGVAGTADDPQGTGSGEGAGSGAGGAGGASGAGTLTAGSTALLTEGGVADLPSLAGEQVTGRGALVESVVADEGFWVGSSPASRVFVFLTPEARRSAGESGFQVEAGQRVDLGGSVELLQDRAPSEFGVEDSEGASQLSEQGAYVNALQIRISAS